MSSVKLSKEIWHLPLSMYLSTDYGNNNCANNTWITDFGITALLISAWSKCLTHWCKFTSCPSWYRLWMNLPKAWRGSTNKLCPLLDSLCKFHFLSSPGFDPHSLVRLTCVIAACHTRAWFSWPNWKRWARGQFHISVIAECCEVHF